MPWSGSNAADKPKETTDALLHSSGTGARYVPNAVEVEALAKLIYGEAGIVPSTMEQAAVVWCVLNRVDDPRFPDTVLEVVKAPYQFSGYNLEYPVKEEFALLAMDVLTRYRAEHDDEENIGWMISAEYCFFTGNGPNARNLRTKRKKVEKRYNKNGELRMNFEIRMQKIQQNLRKI